MKKAIVVGASSGVGKELARILVQNDYKVGITARRENLLNELASEKPDSYVVKPFDLLETDKILNHLDELYKELEDLDLIVVSAGIIKYNVELGYDIEYKTNAVNVIAFTLISNWAFRLFREQKHGHLVGITSVAGARGWRNNPSYNASKAYQINYLEGLRNLATYQKLSLHITTIIPGYMETDMMGKTLVFWVAPVKKAAEQIYRSICKKKKVAFTYRRWRLGYFLYKRIPNILIEKF